MDREKILYKLGAQVQMSGHLLGASVGSGLTAKMALQGGADILLALSGAKYRLAGRNSIASYLCCGNNNAQVMELGTREIFPLTGEAPVLFGLMATEPELNLREYLSEIKRGGFSGVVNFPTVALIDGKFREALEAAGVTYEKEVAAIKIAHELGLFTMAFVTDAAETKQMLEAGADAICVHLGLSKGSAKKYIAIEDTSKVIDEIFKICSETKPEVFRMVYAGPANTLSDMRYLYQRTKCHGYIGGTAFDKIPIEKSVAEIVEAFKLNKKPVLRHTTRHAGDIVEYARQYIEEHYTENISFGALARELNASQSYLSIKFKREVGVTFTEYLMSCRFNKARELVESDRNLGCRDVGRLVGYTDITQFGKMFKKIVGKTFTQYHSDFWRAD